MAQQKALESRKSFPYVHGNNITTRNSEPNDRFSPQIDGNFDPLFFSNDK